MPFRSLPATQGNELLEIGLADVFVSRLGQLTGVRVLPLTATERLKGQEPRQAGRALEATHVLTVALQRDQHTVRAVPQLTLVSDGRIVWSTNVDTDAASVFSIQDIIVTRVIEELAPQLSSGARATLARAALATAWRSTPTCRGRVHVAKPTPKDLMQAAAFFEEALSSTRTMRTPGRASGPRTNGCRLSPGDHRMSSRRRATRPSGRLELQPEHAEATSVLGTVAFWYEWDYPRAEALLRRSLELQPSSADSQVFLAHLLSNIGRFDEALDEIRRAQALDPG